MAALCVCASLLSHAQLFATPWTVARQAPLSMGFFMQDTGVDCHTVPPGDLPDAGIKPDSPVSPSLQADSLPTEPGGSP